MIDHKYDPRIKPSEELESTFICGRDLFDELAAYLKPALGGTVSPQSWVVTGPRGAGKSHLLTLLYHHVRKDPVLSRTWFPVLFPEELFQVDSLYDFLLAVFDHVFKSAAAGEIPHAISTSVNEIKKTRARGSLKQKRDFKYNQTAALFEQLRSLREHLGRPMILMLENLQYLFQNQLSEDDLKLLRGFFHEHPEVFIIIGTALTVFGEIENYGAPFYRFFRIRCIENLDKQGIIDFLRALAGTRKDSGMEEKIRRNRPYIYVYQILTGGNPRLILFLYELLRDQETLSVDLLLGRVTELTPYFLDKTRDESSQRRKILNALAIGAPAQSAGEIAENINEDLRSVAEQLKRLAAEGWVREIPLSAEGIKKKETFYVLRDYFFRIWYRLRTRSIEESDVLCMAELVVILLDREEIAARYERYAATNADMGRLYAQSLQLAGDERFCHGLGILLNKMKREEQEELTAIIQECIKAIDRSDWKELIGLGEKMIKKDDGNFFGYLAVAGGKAALGEHLEAIRNYRRTVAIKPDEDAAWFNMGFSYYSLGDRRESQECFHKAIEICSEDHYEAWLFISICCADLGKQIESYDAFAKYLESTPELPLFTLGNFANYRQIAEKAFDPAKTLAILIDEIASPADRLESLTRMLLLGKFAAVTSEADKILSSDELSQPEAKRLEFYLTAALLDALGQPEETPDLKILLRYWIQLICKRHETNEVRRLYLKLIHDHVKLAGKENVKPEVLELICDQLYQEGVETSETLITILRALKNPNTREARQWMADPLFATIVEALSKEGSNMEEFLPK